MTVDEWAEAFARWQASELAVEAVVTQAVDEPELPEAPHRRDATALAVERLFRLHGFPVAEWAAPLLEAENPLNPPACPAPERNADA